MNYARAYPNDAAVHGDKTKGKRLYSVFQAWGLL